MTKVDLGAIGFCLLPAFIGWRKGLVASALSVAGIVAGAWAGSRLGPELLEGGSDSPYTPLAALAGAAVGAVVLETLGTLAGSALRVRLKTPRLRSFDAIGGVVLGGVAGLAVVWVIGAVAILWPGQTDLREGAQRSFVLRRLNEVVPPVVTAAHVVVGEDDTLVALDSGARYVAQVVAFDVRNDVAVLRVGGLDASPLPLVAPRPGTAVAILGFPENGPLTSTPGRIGRTAVFLSEDAYGHGPVARAITALRGNVRHGDSGAPAIDGDGAVETTVFAARRGSRAGYGVPTDAVRGALDKADGPVSTGGCS